MHNDSFNFFDFNDPSKHTPNHNRSNSRLLGIGTPSNYSNDLFRSNLNESNGVPFINDLEDEAILNTKFDEQEIGIKIYCRYYISLKNIFNSSDIKIKNQLVQYVTEFNNNCKQYANKQTSLCIEAKKNSNEKNRLKEDINQIKEDFDNKVRQLNAEKEEIKENKQKEIEEYKLKLNKAEEQIKMIKKTIDKLNQEIDKKKREIFSLREDYSKVEQPASDYINLSYYLGEQSEYIDINIDCPKKKDFESFSEQFKIVQQNFNVFANMLVDTSNKALEQFRNLYFKIKGKEWIESNNYFIKMHNIQAYNINQELTWTNIMNIHITINNIIKEIFDLVNPKKESDPQKLNDDSCDFLLNYINALRKYSFLQKDVDERAFDKGENFEEKKQNLMNFTKFTKDAEQFFVENWKILNNQNFLEKFKDEFEEGNTEILSHDDFIKNCKILVKKANNISEKQAYELDEYKNSRKKTNTLDDIEMQISASKIKGNKNNGI